MSALSGASFESRSTRLGLLRRAVWRISSSLPCCSCISEASSAARSGQVRFQFDGVGQCWIASSCGRAADRTTPASDARPHDRATVPGFREIRPSPSRIAWRWLIRSACDPSGSGSAPIASLPQSGRIAIGSLMHARQVRYEQLLVVARASTRTAARRTSGSLSRSASRRAATLALDRIIAQQVDCRRPHDRRRRIALDQIEQQLFAFGLRVPAGLERWPPMRRSRSVSSPYHFLIASAAH